MQDVDGREIPQPVTRQDRYLAAILDEVSQVRQLLQRIVSPASDGRSDTADPVDVGPFLADDDVPDVDDLHVGNGWYEIPGVESKVRGREAALDALRRS